MLNFLKEQQSQEPQFSTLSLFYLLGCFEIGISEDAILSIWPDWSKEIPVLRRMGIIDYSSKKRLTLTRILHKYVVETNFSDCEQVQMMALCSYF